METKPMRLLIVDEKNFLSDLDKEGFRSKGVLVFSADNFVSARPYLLKKKVDVVSCNLDFKEGLGLSIYQQLRREFPGDAFLWVATLVTPNPSLEERVLKVDSSSGVPGVDLLIHTPVSKEYFIEKMREGLGQAIRSSQRVVATGTATFCLENSYLKKRIQNLSLSGISVFKDSEDLCEMIPQENKVSMILHLEGLSRPVYLDAQLIREHSDYDCMALRFVDLGEETESMLYQYLQMCKSTQYERIHRSG